MPYKTQQSCTYVYTETSKQEADPPPSCCKGLFDIFPSRSTHVHCSATVLLATTYALIL